ncbi:MAG: hypothetical protein AAGC74_11765 [Verrucomicrobiota bacterium]
MEDVNLFLLFTRPLEAAGVGYMVTGSVAAMIYGEPRLTHDIDMVVEMSRDRAGKLSGWYSEVDFYVPPREVIEEELRRERGAHFNVIHHETGFKADMYPVAGDMLHRWGMAHRERLSIEGEAIWVAPAGYVILRKLEYFREGGSEKHLGDIRAMLEVLGGEGIDRDDLERRVEVMGLGAEWGKVLQEE